MKTENKIHNPGDKFKLKKDLPTWKAGEEMWIGEDGCLYGATKEGDVIMVYHVSTLLNFNILNSEWFYKIEKKKSIFDLKGGDKVYYLNEVGSINCFYNYNVDISKYIENGNVFLTEKEAEAELERRKALQRIKKFMWENGIKNKEFKSYEHNYLICYDDLDKKFYIEYYEISYYVAVLGYFETYEDCQKIIDNCEDDLKIIYNVKDEGVQ